MGENLLEMIFTSLFVKEFRTHCTLIHYQTSASEEIKEKNRKVADLLPAYVPESGQGSSYVEGTLTY